MKKTIPFIFLFSISLFGFAQIEDQPLDSVTEKMIMVEGDSVFKSSIALEEVYLFGKLKFPDYKSKLRYYILRRKTLKVYPYAKLAAEPAPSASCWPNSSRRTASEGNSSEAPREMASP